MQPYTDILTALRKAEVEFIIGGGVACVLHGVERVTMDIDLSIHMTPENFGRFLQVMSSLKLSPRVPINPGVLLQADVLRMLIEEKHALVFTFIDPDLPIRQVDIFLTADMSYGSLLPDSEWVSIGDVEVRVITRPRLLQIKQAISPPRLKDALDIDFLKRHVD